MIQYPPGSKSAADGNPRAPKIAIRTARSFETRGRSMRFTKSLTIAVLISLISTVAWAQPAVKPKGPDASKPAPRRTMGNS